MKYMPVVDVLRLVSAALIVCFHCPESPYKNLTISGLAFFIALMTCLQGMDDESRRKNLIRDRARRLLVPWLFWCLFYALLSLAGRRWILPNHVRFPALLLIGPIVPLWFLPFAFLAAIATSVLKRAVLLSSEAWGLFWLLATSAALTGIAVFEASRLQYPFAQWADTSPLLPIGLAIGMAQHLPRRRLAGHYAAILGLSAAIAWFSGQPSYLIGALAIALAVLPRSREIKSLRLVAGLSMGIYLIHPFVFGVFSKYYRDGPWYIAVPFAFIGSGVASACMASIPWLGRVAFGTFPRAGRTPGRIREPALGVGVGVATE